MDSKRRTERLPMFRVCRYTIAGREYADLSTNISSKGIFIKNFSPPPVGTAILLTVKLSEEWGNLPMRIVGLLLLPLSTRTRTTAYPAFALYPKVRARGRFVGLSTLTMDSPALHSASLCL